MEKVVHPGIFVILISTYYDLGQTNSIFKYLEQIVCELGPVFGHSLLLFFFFSSMSIYILGAYRHLVGRFVIKMIL